MRYIEKSSLDPLVIEAQSILNAASHYNESDKVKDIIRILYFGCCAFCGSSPESSSYFQIEHFYPKAIPKYAKYEKDINNLHYGCQRCNNLKSTPHRPNIFSPNCYLTGTKWNHSKANKIDSELVYIGHILYSVNNRPFSTDRAKETIKLFDLNDDNGKGRSGRRYLVEERLRVYSAVVDILTAIFHLLKDETINDNIDLAIKVLFKSAMKYFAPTSQYSNMVAQNFGQDILKLLEIYLKKAKGRSA